MATIRYAGDRFVGNVGSPNSDATLTGVLDGAYYINTGNLTQYVKRPVGGWAQLAGGGGGGGTPGGDNTQVQFNNAGTFGGDADLTFTDGNRLNVNKLGISGNIYDSNNSLGEGGMVLTNEGQTGVNWKSIESVLSGVGGSGVANYVARWSDEDTITSGVIQDDGTAVGINQAADPDNALAIKSIANNSNPLQIAAHDGDSLLVFRQTAGDGRLSIKKDGGVETIRLDSDNVSYITGANFGIGTASPSRKLTVDGGLAGDNLPVRIIGGNTATSCGLEFQDPTTTADYKVTLGSVGDDMFLQAGGSKRVRVKSDGNVGIGTTTPGSIFHVYSSASAMVKLQSATGNNDIGIDFFRGSDRKWQIRNNGNNDSLFIIPQGVNDADATFAIKSDGNVGIGTNSPSHRLNVLGATTGGWNGLNLNVVISSSNTYANGHAGGIAFGGAYNNSETQTVLAGVWASRPNAGNGQYGGMVHIGARQHNTNNIEKVINVSYASVGIGTNDPYYKLDLRFDNSDTSFSGGSGGNWGGNGLRVENDNTTVGSMALVQFRTATADWFIGNKFIQSSPDRSDFIFNHEDSEKVRITYDGNVGIGTTATDAHLHVSKAAGTTTVLTQVAANSTVGYEIKKTGSTTQHWKIVDGQTVNGTLEFYDATDGATRMSIDGGGDVGIGTANSDSQLQIMNNDSSSYRFGYGGTSDVYLDADDVYFRSDNGGANQITKKGGSLGIGVVNAEHKLHVAGDAIISGYLYDSTNSTGVDGYVLTSKEDGPQWKMIEDVLSGVGGNGTATYIPVWDDSDTIGDSALQDNGSNLLINSASPVDKGMVSNYFRNGNFTGDFLYPNDGNVTIDTNVTHNNFNTLKFDTGPVNANFWDVWDQTDFPHSDEDHWTLSFWAKANVSGSVGIGSVSFGTPGGGGGHEFQVPNNDTWTKFTVYDSTPNNPSSKIECRQDLTNVSGFIHFSEIMTFQGDATYLADENDYIASIYDNSLMDQIYRDVNGNIGIGATAPASKLEVLAADPVLTIRDTEATIASASATLRLAESSATNTLNGHFDLRFVGTASGGDLDISRYNNTSLVTQGIRIKHDGNLGVGEITNPSTKLHIRQIDLADDSRNALLLLDGKFDAASVNSGDEIGIAFNVENSGGGSQQTTCITSSYQVNRNSLNLQPNGGNVGIGTNSPDTLVHMRGSGPTLTLESTGNTDDPVIMLQRNNNTGLAARIKLDNSEGNVFFDNTYDHDNGDILFRTKGNTERVRIKGSGYVGIGTTNPGVKLNVVENDANWAAIIKNENANGYGLSIDCIANTGTTVYALGVYTGAGTGFFVRNKGNVGIGTAQPGAAKLDIYHNGGFTDDLPTARIYHRNLPDSGNNRVAALDINVGMNNGDLFHHGYVQLFQHFTGGAYNSPRLYFSSNSYNSSTNHRQWWGIQALADTTATGDRLAFTCDLSSTNPTATPVHIMSLLTAGNVGIGVVAPDNYVNIREGSLANRPASNSNTSLTIEHHNNTGIQFFSGTQTQIRFGDASSTAAGAIIYKHDDDNFKLNFSNNGHLTINDGSAEIVRVTSDNKVGIGTTNPAHKLEVVDAGAVNIVSRSSGGNASLTIDRASVNDDAQLLIKTASVNKWRIATGLGGNDEKLTVYDDIANVNMMSFKTAVGVGVGPNFGTNEPTAALHVLGDTLKLERANNAPALKLYNNNASPADDAPLGYLQFTGKDNDGTANMVYSEVRGGVQSNTNSAVSGYLSFLTTNNGTAVTEAMRIKADGNVGVGLTVPASVLHVSGGSATIPTLSASHPFTISNAANSGMSIISGTDAAGQVVFGDESDADIGRLRYDHSDNSMRFWTNASEKMRIKSDGNVGIGTTTIGGKLDVNGNVIVRGSLYFDGVSSSYIDNVSHDLQLKGAGGVSLWTHTGGSWVEQLTVADAGAITFNEAYTFPTAIGSAGQVLKVPSTGTVLEWSTETGPVSGTGTANTIPRWTSTTALGDSIITVPSNTSVQVAGPLTATGNITVGPSNDSKIYMGGNDYIAFTDGVGDGFKFVYDNSEKVRITNVGKVGIGTNNPVSLLHIYSSAPEFTIQDGGSWGTNATGYINLKDSSSSMAQIGVTGTAGHLDIKQLKTGSLRLYTNNSERVTILSDGNVGIGVTTANAKLKVVTSNTDVAIFQSTHATTTNFYITNSNATANNTANLYFAPANKVAGALIQAIAIEDFSVSANRTADLAFQTRKDGTMSEKMRIDSSGNVGIGTNNPTGKFQIGANYTIPGTSYGGDDIYIANTGSHSNYDPSVTNTDDFRALITISDGTTTGPTKPGLILYNDDTTAGGFSPMLLFAKRETGASPYKAASAAIYARSPLGTGNSNSWIDGELIFATAGAATQGIRQRMVINKEGLVGIGTNAPVARLHVHETTAGRIQLTNGTSNATASDGLAIAAELSTRAYFWLYENAYMQFATNNAERMRITADGKVGIGTTSPDRKLDVRGNALIKNTLADLMLEGNRTSDGVISRVNFYNTAGSDVVATIAADRDGANDAGAITFDTQAAGGNNTERMRIESDGNVGIGTNDPKSAFHLYRTAPIISLTDSNSFTDADDRFIFRAGAPDGGFFQWYDDSASSTSTLMHIASSGAIKFNTYGSGTHTGTPEYKLSVDSSGNIIETAIGAGQVDGSGTANTIPRWTDTDTIGDSLITVPNNTRVQINGTGTSTFEVHGQSSGGIVFTQIVNTATSAVSNGAGVELRAKTTTQERQLSYITSRWLDNTDASRKSRLIITTQDGGTGYNTYQAYGKNPILAADSGCVGIGTTTPGQKLHVNGSAEIDGSIYLNDTNTRIFEGSGNSVRLETNSGYIDVGPQNATYAHLQTDRDRFYFNKELVVDTGIIRSYNEDLQFDASYSGAVAKNIIFRTGNVEKMRMDTAGSFGIGTNGPAAKLDVSGNILRSGLYYSSWTSKSINSITSGSSTINYILIAPKTTINVRLSGRFNCARGNGVSAVSIAHADVVFCTDNDANPQSGGIHSAASDIPSYGHANFEIVELEYDSTEYYALKISPSASWVASFNHIEFEGIASSITWTNIDSGNVSNIGAFGGSQAVFAYKHANVGIGTDSPSARLHITSDGSHDEGAEIVLRHANNNSTDVVSTLSFQNNGGQVAMIQAGTTSGSNNGYISFFTDNAGTSGERMRITSNGDVVIGNTTPYNKLHVYGSGRINNLIVGNCAASNTPAAALHIKSSGTDAVLRIEDLDSSNQVFDFLVDQGVGLQIIDKGTGSSTNPRLTIDTAGNVGIGTTVPGSYKLHVNGNTMLDGTAYVDDALTVDGNINFESVGQYITFYGNSNTHHSISSRSSAGSPNDDIRINTYGALFINLDSNGNDDSESHSSFQIGRHAGTGAVSASDLLLNLSGETGKLRLYKYGSGTHTGTAEYKLSVDSDGNVIETAIGAGAVDGSGTANYITRWTDTDTIGNSNIFDNGTIGIGTDSNLNGKVTIRGQGNSVGDNHIFCQLSHSAVGYGASIFLKTSTTNTNNRYGARIRAIRNDNNNAAADLAFSLENTGATALAEVVRFTSDGCVGIGITNPSTLLEVGGDADEAALIGKARIGMMGYAGYAAFGHRALGSVVGKYAVLQDANGGSYFNAATGQTVSFRIGNSDQMVLSSGQLKFPDSKKIIMGTGNDLEIYHDGSHSYIKGTTTGDLYVISENDDVVIRGADDVFIYTQGGEDAITARGNGAVELHYNATKTFQTTANGVKLSQSAASYLFGGDDEILAGQDSSGYYFATGNGQDINKPIFIGDNASYIKFKTSNAEQVRIDSNGSVGIGTTSPTQKLDVSGNVRAGNYRVQTGNQRTKYRLWDSSSHYGMGMHSDMTFGGLNDYALTLQMNNDADRGLWFGDSSQTAAQGAMAVTTGGKMTVAHSIRVGYGESDTTTPGATYRLDISGEGYITGNLGLGGTLTEASSLAIKENIETFEPSLDIISKIRPVKYDKKTTGKKEIGLIAEELAELFPELVEKDKNGNPSGVNYSRAVTVLLGGFKELYKEVQELKKRI